MATLNSTPIDIKSFDGTIPHVLDLSIRGKTCSLSPESKIPCPPIKSSPAVHSSIHDQYHRSPVNNFLTNQLQTPINNNNNIDPRKSPIDNKNQFQKSPIDNNNHLQKFPIHNNNQFQKSLIHNNNQLQKSPIHKNNQFQKNPINNNNQLQKSPINNNNQLQKSPVHVSTSLDQFRVSPVNVDQFQNIPLNNNCMDQFHTPTFNMYVDQLQNSGSVMYRQKHTVQTEIDSSEDGSVKSDSASDFSAYGVSNVPHVNNVKSKSTRPFKAYPKDPFFLAFGACSADAILGKESAEAYAEFRQKMLQQVQANNPEPGVTNAKMRRSTLPTSTEDMDGKGASYWEKRKKNNEAAKRSRDARRAKEDEIAIRAAFLEQENLKLKYEIAALRNETTKLRCLMYN